MMKLSAGKEVVRFDTFQVRIPFIEVNAETDVPHVDGTQ